MCCPPMTGPPMTGWTGLPFSIAPNALDVVAVDSNVRAPASGTAWILRFDVIRSSGVIVRRPARAANVEAHRDCDPVRGGFGFRLRAERAGAVASRSNDHAHAGRAETQLGIRTGYPVPGRTHRQGLDHRRRF